MRRKDLRTLIVRWGKDLNLIPHLLLGFLLASPFVIRTTVQPITTFEPKVGGSGQEVVEDVVETADSDYVVTESTTSYASGGEDVYIVRPG